MSSVPWKPYQHKNVQGISIQNSNGLPSFRLSESQEKFFKGLQPLLTNTGEDPARLEDFLRQHPVECRELLNVLLPFDYRDDSVLYEFPILKLCKSYFRLRQDMDNMDNMGDMDNIGDIGELSKKAVQDRFFQKLQILMKYGADLNIYAYDTDTANGRKYKRPRGVYTASSRTKDNIGGGWHTLAHQIYYGLYESMRYVRPDHPQYPQRKKLQKLALQIMQKLFELGWDLDVPVSETGETLVYKAVFMEDIVLLTWLLERGADPDIGYKYHTGNAPAAASDAYRGRKKKVLQLLLSFGSRFSQKDAEECEVGFANPFPSRVRPPNPVNPQDPGYIHRMSIYKQAADNAAKKRQQHQTRLKNKRSGLLVAHQLMKRKFGGASQPAPKRAKKSEPESEPGPEPEPEPGPGPGSKEIDYATMLQQLSKRKQDNMKEFMQMTLPKPLYSKFIQSLR